MLLEEKLILFRNELKNKTIYNYKLSGIVLELLFSKKIFIKNIEIKKFIKEIFGLELKDYIFKSRSSIGIKISKSSKSIYFIHPSKLFFSSFIFPDFFNDSIFSFTNIDRFFL